MHHTIKLGVQKFRKASRLPQFNKKGVPPKERIQLCAALCLEETIELVEAMGASEASISLLKLVAKDAIDSIDPKRVVMKEVADAYGDSDYVNEWGRCEFGIHGEPVADEIQRTNMAKFGPGSYFSPAGKVQKPPGWKPPDIQAVLDNQENVSWVVLGNEDRTDMGLTSVAGWQSQMEVGANRAGLEPLFYFSAPDYERAKEVYEFLLDADLL